MSKFKTSIAFDVKHILGILPPGAFVNGVTWDKDTHEVRVEWEHEQFSTGRDFAVEFPVENLSKEEEPEGVKFTRRAVAKPVVIVEVQTSDFAKDALALLAATAHAPADGTNATDATDAPTTLDCVAGEECKSAVEVTGVVATGQAKIVAKNKRRN